MKRKTAFLMAAMMAVTSVFADGLTVFALEEAETVIEVAADTSPEESEESSEITVADSVTEAEANNELLTKETIEGMPAVEETEGQEFGDETDGTTVEAAEDIAELPQESEFSEVESETFAEQTVGSETTESEFPIEEDYEISVDLDSDKLINVAATDTLALPMDDTSVIANGGVTLDANYFSDENFRIDLGYNWDEWDVDNDNVLSSAEIEEIERMYVGEAGIKDLTGIEYFTNLTYLDCSLNQLTKLDVSHNTMLEGMNCSNNPLGSLDVSNNTKLNFLDCHSNNLTSLDVSKNTRLETFWCYDNQLTTLDVSNSTNLYDLSCYGNNLTVLNFGGIVNLIELDCDDNQLKELDVHLNRDLEHLDCRDNCLTELNVRPNMELIGLDCSGNQLTELDVSDNEYLEGLGCGGNSLGTLDVSKNEYLTSLDCTGCQLKELNVSNNPDLRELACGGNQLKNLDVSKNQNLEYFWCDGNALATLDVSQNTKLIRLECGNNQLTSLDVSTSKDLFNLNCENNQLTSLNLGAKTDFAILHCNGNRLTSLNLESLGLSMINCELSPQTQAVQLKDVGNGQQLDMANLVGKDNLAKVHFISKVPAMGSDGVITFSGCALPESVSYNYTCAVGDDNVPLNLEVTLALTGRQSGHSFGNYEITKEPTVLEEGIQTRKCTGCGAEESTPVPKLTPTMELNVTSIKLKTKQSTTKVKVSGLAAGDAIASWTTSNPKIVTVNANGKISAKSKKGKATITVTLKSGLTGEVKVTVQKKAVACTKVTLNKKSVTLKKD